jgi:2-polyprenyl-3-methyl-5-hydroxy-6-metoxy-1,4-benzoquinol methylase
MAEDSAAVHDAALLDTVVPLVPGLAGRLRAGIDVADVGCGSGHAINLLAQAFPASRFVGSDLAEDAIAAARREAASLGLANTRFEVRDVAGLAEVGAFDFVTAFDAIHDQAHPATVLRGITDVLAPDGVFLMADIKASSRPHENMDQLTAPFLYAVSLMHCMTVSLAQDGTGLGAAWGEQTATRMLHDAGFGSVDVREAERDLINSYYVARLAGNGVETG